MKEEKLLFEIKTLEKLIVRKLIKNKEERPKKLSPTQLQILEYIHKHENEDIYQKDLEAILNLRRATVSGVLQTMEKNNIISRVVNEKDYRTKKIILNEETKQNFEHHKKRLQSLEKKITENIDSHELKICIDVIKQMKENIKKINEI